ncbi:MAG: ketopantoate reductase family protein [Gemmatimonadaceae bacterium]|nr:ketopantoate reductase family protein [Gemmatimonadaceae bacterium]
MRRILVLGAGVLGSLYAARLRQSGRDVTLLARNTRLADIKKYGIVLEHALSGMREVVTVPVIERLHETDGYDLIVVLVRKNQVASVLPMLASHTATPSILFMVNNPSGYADWEKAVGSDRLVLGFAGAGGTRVGHVVRYVVVSRLLQPTTFGELDGSTSPRLRELMQVFREAGFPTSSTSSMDAWQKTHVGWVSPLANALYMVNCDNHVLARSPHVVRLAVRAVREGFSVLRTLGLSVTPARLRLWEWIPMGVLVRTLMLWADTNHFRVVAVEHTAAAIDEMRQLADEFRALTVAASIATPAIDELRSFIPRAGQIDASA